MGYGFRRRPPRLLADVSKLSVWVAKQAEIVEPSPDPAPAPMPVSGAVAECLALLHDIAEKFPARFNEQAKKCEADEDNAEIAESYRRADDAADVIHDVIHNATHLRPCSERMHQCEMVETQKGFRDGPQI